MITLPAIYENGVFRPLGTVRLPEHTQVQVAVPDPPSLMPARKEKKDHLLAEVRTLRGSLSFPGNQNDADLITTARLEKYGLL